MEIGNVGNVGNDAVISVHNIIITTTFYSRHIDFNVVIGPAS